MQRTKSVLCKNNNECLASQQAAVTVAFAHYALAISHSLNWYAQMNVYAGALNTVDHE
jgi:hypothetical protein